MHAASSAAIYIYCPFTGFYHWRTRSVTRREKNFERLYRKVLETEITIIWRNFNRLLSGWHHNLTKIRYSAWSREGIVETNYWEVSNESTFSWNTKNLHIYIQSKSILEISEKKKLEIKRGIPLELPKNKKNRFNSVHFQIFVI